MPEADSIEGRLQGLVKAAIVEALNPIYLHLGNIDNSVQGLRDEQRRTNGRVGKAEDAILSNAHKINDHALAHAHVAGVEEGRKEVQAVLTKGQIATLATLGALGSSVLGIIVRFA